MQVKFQYLLALLFVPVLSCASEVDNRTTNNPKKEAKFSLDYDEQTPYAIAMFMGHLEQLKDKIKNGQTAYTGSFTMGLVTIGLDEDGLVKRIDDTIEELDDHSAFTWHVDSVFEGDVTIETNEPAGGTWRYTIRADDHSFKILFESENPNISSSTIEGARANDDADDDSSDNTPSTPSPSP